MSAIGGIADLKRGEINFESINKMRIAMTLRGRKRSTAYMGKFVSFVYNSSKENAFENDEDTQPAIFERGGKEYALCVDSSCLYSAALFERYRIDGIDLLGALVGDFSLALYDGDRNMLVLARDREGKRPLYYKIRDGKVYFASEIRGILSAAGELASVSREMISLHISAPMGVYRAANIYTDVSEVLPGECLLFSEFGMSRFRYRDQNERKFSRKSDSKPQHIVEPYVAVCKRSVEESLADALIAFEYPQFDVYMPKLCELLSSAGKCEQKSILYYDPIRRENISYAVERADRLGAFYGIQCVGVTPKRDAMKEKSNEIFFYLYNRFLSLSSAEISLLSDILGKRKLSYLMRRFDESQKKEDTESELRILGMLCQTVMWAETQKLVIRSTVE
jgi:hypothetical protein